MASRKRKSSPGSNVGCLVLLVGIVVLGALFLVKLPDIKQALKNTKFLDLIGRKIATTTSTTAAPVQPAPLPAAPASSDRPSAQQPQGQPAGPQPSTPADQDGARQASLFFVRIDDSGSIVTREVRRRIKASDSPLTDALKALIEGPSEAEIKAGLVSLLPHGTRLLGAVVRGSTASVDLSEEFMYNRYGTEGFGAQLRQIVYTATSFPSVQDVQILVQGKARDYLGGEGIYIGKPLSRNSF